MSSERPEALPEVAEGAGEGAGGPGAGEHIDLERGTMRAIFDHSPVAISVVQVGGESRRLYYNASYEKLFKGETDAPVVPLADSYVDVEDRTRIRRAMEEKGRLEGMEVERRRADGTTFWVHMSSQRVDIGGEEADVVWVFDISDRKRAETASAENEARLHAIIDNTPAPITLKDADGRYMLVNKSFLARRDLSLDDVIGKSADDFFTSPETAEAVAAQDKETLESGQTMEFELTTIEADGGEHTYISYRFPIFGPGGEIIGLGGVNTDITERKEMEQAQRDLLEAISLPIVVSRADTNELLYVNQRASDLYGISVGEGGRSVTDAYVDSADRQELVRRLTEEGRLDDFEARVFNADGKQIWVLMSARTFTYRGHRSVLVASYDIDERKRLEQDVAEKEAQLRTALDNMSDGLFVIDGDFRVQGFNNRYLELVDVPPETVYPGAPFIDILRIRATRGDYGPGDPEALVETRLQGYRDLDTSVVVDQVPGGRTLEMRRAAIDGGGVVAVLTDVTERKKAETELAAKEAQLRSALDTMSGAIFMIDQDFTIRVLNERLLAFYDISPERLHVGGSFLELLRLRAERGDYGPGDPEALLAARIEGYFEDPVPVVEDRVPSGRILEVRRSLTEDGGMVGVCNDITDRVRLQEEAAEKSAILEATMNNTDAGILMVDGDMQVAAYNRRFLDLLDLPDDIFESDRSLTGYLRKRVMRGDYGAGDPDEMVDSLLARIDAIDADGEPFIGEVSSPTHPDVELRLNRVGDGGFVSSYIDVAERKRAERELLEARDAAEEATKAKAAFLATMSHEIRTPMNGVIGMIDLLSETRLDDDQREMTDTVRNSAHALLTIINDILDFSKIEAGQLDLESIPVSVRDVVEGVAETLAPNARKKNIALRAYVDPEIPDAVIGDSVRLGQILFNLAGNAVKFTEDGKVLMRADRVPGSSADGVAVRFRIVDTGIGISKEQQDDLFTAFTQAEASTTRRYGGTGLGLSICLRLSELMGGTIGVESEPGEGSTFTVDIDFPVGPGDAFDSDGQDLSGLSVLQVSRDADFTDLFGHYLRYWKATVDQDHDLDRAVPLARKAAERGAPYDVVILGSGWPTADGRRVIEAFRGEPLLADTRFVLMNPSRRRSEREAIENTVHVDARPTRRASYIRAVAQAAGRVTPDVEERPKQASPRRRRKAPSVEAATAMGQLILMAEDNPTNQALLGRQLNRLGFAAEVANDGQEALAALAGKSYALLLTDCHMPNMDGFELAKSVRRDEAGGEARLPIVAITASAMQEDSDRCFEAGMDDFLVKPVELDKLKETLRRWMPEAAEDDEAPTVGTDDDAPAAGTDDDAPAAGSGASGPVDVSVLVDLFGGDPEPKILRDMLRAFVKPSLGILGDMRRALDGRSAVDVEAAAHKLKSSARAIGARDLAALCDSLEEAGKSDDWETIEKAAPRLEPSIDEVVRYIETY